MRHHNNTQAGWIEDDAGHSHREPITNPDMASEIDTTVDEWLESTIRLSREEAVRWCYTTHQAIVEQETERTQTRIIAKFVSQFLVRPHHKLQVYGIMFAAGLEELQGLTQTEVAKGLGLTRAAVSKVSVWWRRALGIHPSRYQKSKSACQSYSKIQKAEHWRRLRPEDFKPGKVAPENTRTDLIEVK